VGVPISIIARDGRLAVSTPFHPDFPSRARVLGGEWDAARRVWLFDPGDDERVRTLCREIYGTDAGEPFSTPAAIGCASGCSLPVPAPIVIHKAAIFVSINHEQATFIHSLRLILYRRVGKLHYGPTRFG